MSKKMLLEQLIEENNGYLIASMATCEKRETIFDKEEITDTLTKIKENETKKRCNPSKYGCYSVFF